MLRRSFSSFHYITIIGYYKLGAGLRDWRWWYVVNATFHFVAFSLAFYMRNFSAKFRFVSTLLQLYVSCWRNERNKFIHAKNLPNRINIFIYEFIFGGGRMEGCRERNYVYINVLQFSRTRKSYVFMLSMLCSRNKVLLSQILLLARRIFAFVFKLLLVVMMYLCFNETFQSKRHK